jgi:hypothetical protein
MIRSVKSFWAACIAAVLLVLVVDAVAPTRGALAQEAATFDQLLVQLEQISSAPQAQQSGMRQALLNRVRAMQRSAPRQSTRWGELQVIAGMTALRPSIVRSPRQAPTQKQQALLRQPPVFSKIVRAASLPPSSSRRLADAGRGDNLRWVVGCCESSRRAPVSVNVSRRWLLRWRRTRRICRFALR